MGRSGDVAADAAAVAAVQSACPPAIALRADANRLLSLPQALHFAQQLAHHNVQLEYLEEPVSNPQAHLASFIADTSVPVALDESVDEHLIAAEAVQGERTHAPTFDSLSLDRKVDGAQQQTQQQLAHEGVAALVLKPSVLGSLEDTVALVHWAAQHGMSVTVSSAFESSAGMCKLAAIAGFADATSSTRQQSTVQHRAQHNISAQHQQRGVAHGLGTLSWFADDVSSPLALIQVQAADGSKRGMCLSIDSIASTEAAVQEEVSGSPQPERAARQTRWLEVQLSDGTQYEARVLHFGAGAAQHAAAQPRRAVLLLHGFLGAADDWQAIAAGLQASGTECAAVDLPGHGRTASTTQQRRHIEPDGQAAMRLDLMAAFVSSVIDALGWSADRHITLVGYSLGARIALQGAAGSLGSRVQHVVSISGSPGIRSATAAQARIQKDAQTAQAMCGMTGSEFVSLWYSAPMWASLRQHPRATALTEQRGATANMAGLADVLQGCSPGHQNVWCALEQGDVRCRVSMIVGANDQKFCGVARSIAGECVQQKQTHASRAWTGEHGHQVFELTNAGHAVHIEQPLAVLQALQALLTGIEV